jgi:hypothetical protein
MSFNSDSDTLSFHLANAFSLGTKFIRASNYDIGSGFEKETVVMQCG